MTRWRHDHHDRRHVVYWGKGLKPTPPNSLMWPQKGSQSPKGVWHEKPLCTWNQSLAFFCDVRNGHLDWESLIQRVVGLHLNIYIYTYIYIYINNSQYISKILKIYLKTSQYISIPPLQWQTFEKYLDGMNLQLSFPGYRRKLCPSFQFSQPPRQPHGTSGDWIRPSACHSTEEKDSSPLFLGSYTQVKIYLQ